MQGCVSGLAASHRGAFAVAVQGNCFQTALDEIQPCCVIWLSGFIVWLIDGLDLM